MSSKPRRTVLSGIVTPLTREASHSVPVVPAIEQDEPARRRSATKESTKQQTLYLPPAVHEQLRELAFSERVKMHALIMEGLDSVFRARGLKSIADLTRIS
ncbi:MAG: ribbon-helix-helix domain-containing protein [Methylocystis sp.]